MSHVGHVGNTPEPSPVHPAKPAKAAPVAQRPIPAAEEASESSAERTREAAHPSGVGQVIDHDA
jgi:hypothetical protein